MIIKERNTLLAKALSNNSNPQDTIGILASKIFELMTGTSLFNETDILNGEDYAYKAGENQEITSMRVHPEVANWFGWINTSGVSASSEYVALIMLSRSEAIIALNTNLSEFTIK